MPEPDIQFQCLNGRITWEYGDDIAGRLENAISTTEIKVVNALVELFLERVTWVLGEALLEVDVKSLPDVLHQLAHKEAPAIQQRIQELKEATTYPGPFRGGVQQ